MAELPKPVSERPKILWFAFKLFDKSVDKATWLEMIEGLSNDFDVRFLTLYRDNPMPLIAAGNSVCYVPRIGSGLLAKISVRVMAFISLLKIIITFRPDALIINGDPPFLILRFIYVLKKYFGFATVFDVRTLPVGERQQQGERRLRKSLNFAAKRLSGVTYITEEMRKYCTEKFDLPFHRSAIWTSGVNTNSFVPDSIPNEGKFKLVYHGGILSRSRGILSLVEAMALLSDIPVELHLVSSLREPEVTSAINQLGLTDRVLLHETMLHAEIPGFINNCHAGIIPLPNFVGWNTSSPIKLFEYLACGRPVIITPIPAHLNVLAGKSYAFFAARDDASALATAIREAYTSLQSFDKLSALARAEAVSFHTWKAQSKVLGDFIYSLMRAGKKQL